MKKSLTVGLILGLSSCAAAPNKIPDHKVYADEADALEHSGEVLRFAVVGNVRAPIPVVDKAGRKGPTDGINQAIVTDLRRQVDRKQLDFVALMGDSVRWSSTGEWKTFDSLWQEVLDGETVPTTEGYRIPTMPVVGDVDSRSDKRLQGVYGAFPEVGVDIGHARVASWYSFDVRVEGAIWRMIVLDSNKDRLGSRWNEQLYWIPEATEGRFDHVLVFMHDPVVTLTKGTEPNVDGAPMELIEAVEESAGLMKIRAVFSAEPHSTEVFLPSGPLGEAHFTAGGGGAPAETQERWGNGDSLGYGDLQLEPLFDLALQNDFDRQASAQTFPDEVIDHAKAMGTWEGFTAAYDARYFPLYGYWIAEIQGDELRVAYEQHQSDGSFKEAYHIKFIDGKWRPKG